MLIPFTWCILATTVQGIVLPPACTGAYPFELEAGLLSSATGVFFLAILGYFFGPAGGVVRLLTRIGMSIAVILYPTVAAMAFGFLNCVPTEMTTTALASLDGGSTVDLSAKSETVTVKVLVSNPFFVCWTGSHFTIGAFNTRVAVSLIRLLLSTDYIDSYVASLQPPCRAALSFSMSLQCRSSYFYGCVWIRGFAYAWGSTLTSHQLGRQRNQVSVRYICKAVQLYEVEGIYR